MSHDDCSDHRHDGLITRLRLLRTESDAVIASLEQSGRPVELDQTVQGCVSRIDAITQQQMARASRSRLQSEVRGIDAALARAGRGMFGLCCRCELPIAPARLDADPTATFCRDCLGEIEEQKRLQGRSR